MEVLNLDSLTLETLPKAFSLLSNDIIEIKRLLQNKSFESPPDPDLWFDLTELCNYLPDKPTKPTVYGWIQVGSIPYHKGAKKLRFLKSEIDAWLKLSKRKTTTELQAEAETYLSKNKKGRL